MAAMPRLVSVTLENNRFTGAIPAEYAERVAGGSLGRLLLGGNYLHGPIPGEMMGLRPGSVNLSLVDNCLNKCPDYLFFCRGRHQKSPVDCETFGS
ncbi:hypothetical protein MLD38_034395 [Melastoma candidum]|nr:hypothetical protein MLD38_034395 [Melastoma candidum]